jgi:hypothetical protein
MESAEDYTRQWACIWIVVGANQEFDDRKCSFNCQYLISFSSNLCNVMYRQKRYCYGPCMQGQVNNIFVIELRQVFSNIWVFKEQCCTSVHWPIEFYNSYWLSGYRTDVPAEPPSHRSCILQPRCLTTRTCCRVSTLTTLKSKPPACTCVRYRRFILICSFWEVFST